MIVKYFRLFLVFGDETVLVLNILDGTTQDLSLNVSQHVATEASSSSIHKNLRVSRTTEIIGKTTFQLEDEHDQNSMTNVRTKSVNTISIKIVRKNFREDHR